MDKERKGPENTREFLAMWNDATAEHLAHRVTGILQQLSRSGPPEALLNEAQAAALSPLVVRALQIAAAPDGGVHAAVQFLGEFAADAGSGG
jgi:hypothetical protein